MSDHLNGCGERFTSREGACNLLLRFVQMIREKAQERSLVVSTFVVQTVFKR